MQVLWRGRTGLNQLCPMLSLNSKLSLMSYSVSSLPCTVHYTMATPFQLATVALTVINFIFASYSTSERAEKNAA